MSGVTSDPKKAICEYIWNGFDANATCVSLNYEATELGARDSGDRSASRANVHDLTLDII